MSANNSQRSNFLGYDIFKLVVALILLIILILLLLRGCSSAGGQANVTQEATAASTEISQPTEAATISPTENATTAPAAIEPVITAPKDGDSVIGYTITITGTGQPGATLNILDSGKVAGQVTASDEGKWFFTGQIEPGQHTFIAATTDGSSKSKPVTIASGVVTPTPSPSATSVPPTSTPAVASGGAGCSGLISGHLLDKDHYVVGSCDTLSGIAVWLKVTVDDLLASNPQITNPDKIVPGDVVNVPPRPEQDAP